MSKIKRLLRRILGNDCSARPITLDDVHECIWMAVNNLAESGMTTTPDSIDRLADYFISSIGDDNPITVFVSVHGEEITGMVSCSLIESVPWDSRRAMSVWLAYVKPRFRRSSQSMISLLRAWTEYGKHIGAMVCRITVDEKSERLIKHYESLFGFKPEQSIRIYSMEFGG